MHPKTRRTHFRLLQDRLRGFDDVPHAPVQVQDHVLDVGGVRAVGVQQGLPQSVEVQVLQVQLLQFVVVCVVLQATEGGWAGTEWKREGGGGGGSEAQKSVHQKWPKPIFPFANFMFSRYEIWVQGGIAWWVGCREVVRGHFRGGGEGGNPAQSPSGNFGRPGPSLSSVSRATAGRRTPFSSLFATARRHSGHSKVTSPRVYRAWWWSRRGGSTGGGGYPPPHPMVVSWSNTCLGLGAPWASFRPPAPEGALTHAPSPVASA